MGAALVLVYLKGMDQFNFEIDEHTGTLKKRGHYSHSETRDATREEVLLWRRIQELEVCFETRRSSQTQKLLERIPKKPGTLIVSAENFALLRREAPDVVRMEDSPNLVRRGILGSILWYDEEGLPRSIWVRVRRERDFSFKSEEA
jgi:hypothetical protein